MTAPARTCTWRSYVRNQPPTHPALVRSRLLSHNTRCRHDSPPQPTNLYLRSPRRPASLRAPRSPSLHPPSQAWHALRSPPRRPSNCRHRLAKRAPPPPRSGRGLSTPQQPPLPPKIASQLRCPASSNTPQYRYLGRTQMLWSRARLPHRQASAIRQGDRTKSRDAVFDVTR